MVDLYLQALHKVDHISRRLEKNLVLQAQMKLLQKQNQNNNPALLLKSNQFLYYIISENLFWIDFNKSIEDESINSFIDGAFLKIS